MLMDIGSLKVEARVERGTVRMVEDYGEFWKNVWDSPGKPRGQGRCAEYRGIRNEV